MKVEAQKGDTIFYAIQKCKDDLKQIGDTVQLEFNGIIIDVNYNSAVNDLVIIYELKSHIRRIIGDGAYFGAI